MESVLIMFSMPNVVHPVEQNLIYLIMFEQYSSQFYLVKKFSTDYTYCYATTKALAHLQYLPAQNCIVHLIAQGWSFLFIAIPDDWQSPIETAITDKRIDIQAKNKDCKIAYEILSLWIVNHHWAQTVRIWFLALWKFAYKNGFRRVTHARFNLSTPSWTGLVERKLLTS